MLSVSGSVQAIPISELVFSHRQCKIPQYVVCGAWMAHLKHLFRSSPVDQFLKIEFPLGHHKVSAAMEADCSATEK